MAEIAKAATDSDSPIERLIAGPKSQIETSKIRVLGMTFSGRPLLEQTTGEPVASGA